MKTVSTMVTAGVFVFAGFLLGQGPPATVVPSVTAGQDEDTSQAANKWMKAKQHNAHTIFDGLTEGDFEKVTQGASFMLGSTALEQWLSNRNYLKHHEYEGEANAFEFSVKELRRHARQQDLDGALTAYVTMSRSCVRCHRLIRDE